jgi:hypothetical protein
MRERKPQHFKLGSDQVGVAKCASESRSILNLVATKWGMPNARAKAAAF